MPPFLCSRSPLLMALAGVIITGLMGCVNVHPRYHADTVVWDAGLLGQWQARDAEGRVIALSIEPREVLVDPQDQRINPDPNGGSRFRRAPGDEPAEASQPVALRQYLLRYTTPDGTDWVLEGYLLQVEGHRFLAIQLNDEFIEQNAGWVLPVHSIWKLEQGDGELRFFSPEEPVAWIPGIEWADADGAGGTRPIQPRSGAARGIRIAESLDRVLAYHAAHANDPDFWHQDSSMRFHRP